jgi:hypothetical protein
MKCREDRRNCMKRILQVTVMKSWRITWVKPVEHIREIINACNNLAGEAGRTILKRTLKR